MASHPAPGRALSERLASSTACYRTTGRVTESTTVPRGQAAAAANRYESRCNDEDGGRDQPKSRRSRAVPAVGAGDGCGASEGAVDGTLAAAASAVKVKLP